MSAVAPLRAAAGSCAERNRKKLRDEFGSVLDESLIYLIENERDVVKDFKEIWKILQGLAKDATAEAATGFDPSGLGCNVSEMEQMQIDETTTSGDRKTSEGLSGDCSSTTLSSDISSEHHESHNLTNFTDLSEDEKVRQLQGIFIDRFKEHTLKFVLKESKGDLDRAFDELLTRQYLEDSGQDAKGINAFLMPDAPYQRTKKGKKNKGGNSKPKNTKLVVNYTNTPVDASDELQGAKDFIQPFRSRTPVIPRPFQPPSLSPVSIPAYTAQSTAALSPTSPLDYGAAHLRSAAALRSKGPLGRQAAVVYTERAREANRTAMAQSSALADDYVRQRSSDAMVDLHGVFVLDGVRIARQHVWAWWKNLEGENRAARAKEGFTVVTGQGKHSAGGVSRMRQAVAAMLKNDGWKVETQTGSFFVFGRA
ncbi:hypothetical protein QBC38DRAFT_6919 [Podospora fimiseda]|uniref:Smr domain-containing protein n=1 Tax=Podospora fimiseda TaxID=252190 RepID=A0AAN7BZS1_9PEZI|nr:hypothetical protein QBC38DRAFT_6919 [Podospora fimiseda]